MPSSDKRIAALEKLAHEQAAHISDLRAQVTGLAAQVATLTALVSARNGSAVPARRDQQLDERASALPRDSLVQFEDGEPKPPHDMGALPEEDPGSPLRLRAVLNGEDSKDSKDAPSVREPGSPIPSIASNAMHDSPPRSRVSSVTALDGAPYVFEEGDEVKVAVRDQSHQRGIVFTGFPQDDNALIKRELDDDSAPRQARPAKRTRFDGVLVPPPPRTLKEHLHARLRNVPVIPITLDSTIANVGVPRQFVADHFGGNMRAMSVTFNDEHRRKHGHAYTHVLFPRVTINATVPRTPGEPGLIFLARNRERWPMSTQKVLVGLADSHWQYMCDYNLVRSEPMSPAEFKALPTKIQTKWGAILYHKDKDRVIRVHRALFNQLGRAPSDQEAEDALNTNPDEMFRLDPEDITEAFRTGFWVMYTWRMECVGYDEDFQRRIATLYPPWAQEKERKQKEARPRQKGSVKQQRLKTPKVEDDVDGDSDVSYA